MHNKLMTNQLKHSFVLWLLLGLLTGTVWAQTTPGTLETYATIHSIGIEWDLSGDPEHNASALVDYRVNGSAQWQPAQPLFRVDFEGYNMLAGSILFLNPDTEYEVKLTLSDSDGVVGGNPTVRTELVRTQKVPQIPTSGILTM